MNELYNIIKELTGTTDFSQKGLLFHTENTIYFFDSGTGKTFECDQMNVIKSQQLY